MATQSNEHLARSLLKKAQSKLRERGRQAWILLYRGPGYQKWMRKRFRPVNHDGLPMALAGPIDLNQSI
jgi:16S rRNA G1207 methylase RsmC